MLQVSNRALVKLKKQNIILVAVKRKSSPIYLFAIITSSTILTTGRLLNGHENFISVFVKFISS